VFDVRCNDKIVFPPFALDLAAGRLLRGSDVIRLRPKAFRVLQYLLERPGQLVSKEELLECNWPGVHVGEHVVKVSVAEIRKALSDAPRTSRFIETAHRRGYRFIGRTETTARSLSAPISFSGKWPKTNFKLPKAYGEVTAIHDAKIGHTNTTVPVLGESVFDVMFVIGWTEASLAGFLSDLSSFSHSIPLESGSPVCRIALLRLSDRVSP